MTLLPQCPMTRKQLMMLINLISELPLETELKDFSENYLRSILSAEKSSIMFCDVNLERIQTLFERYAKTMVSEERSSCSPNTEQTISTCSTIARLEHNHVDAIESKSALKDGLSILEAFPIRENIPSTTGSIQPYISTKENGNVSFYNLEQEYGETFVKLEFYTTKEIANQPKIDWWKTNCWRTGFFLKNGEDVDLMKALILARKIISKKPKTKRLKFQK